MVLDKSDIEMFHLYLLGLVFAILEYLGLQLEGTPYIFSSLLLICQIFATIGVWRSANKYKGKKIFGILAKAFMLIAFIYIFMCVATIIQNLHVLWIKQIA